MVHILRNVALQPDAYLYHKLCEIQRWTLERRNYAIVNVNVDVLLFVVGGGDD